MDARLIDYLSIPHFNVASGMTLTRELVTVMPAISRLPGSRRSHVRAAAQSLRDQAAALQGNWAALAATDPGLSSRQADRALDIAWATLLTRLKTYSRLPVHSYPRATEAAALLDQLFPDGLGFLRLTYREEWAESERRLHAINTEQLAQPLNELCGPEFLENVRTAHETYGKVLGITEAQEDAPLVRVLEPLRALRDALSQYALQVVAAADNDDAVEVAHELLRPIVVLRDRRRTTDSTPETDEDEVSAPIPELGEEPESDAS